MQVAMQSRIKLFWRPEAIRKKSGELTEMRMEITANAKRLTVHNPTPYYITLAWLSKNAKTMLPGFDSLMIAPSPRQLPLPAITTVVITASATSTITAH